MANNSLSTWFGNGLDDATRRRARLGVQLLETRDAPAIFTVSTDGLTFTGPNFEGGLTLSKAIQLANATPGIDTIAFNLPPIINPSNGSPVYARRTILVPTTGLPAITDPVIIDGTPHDNLGINNGKNNYGIASGSS